MFEADSQRRTLRAVNATESSATTCAKEAAAESCLPLVRWREFSVKMKAIGVDSIHREDIPGVYFQSYRSRLFTDAIRLRGLVYAPGVSRVTHDHDDVEERVDLGSGWYLYLIVDR